MQTQWMGPPRCILIPGGQQSRRFIDLTSSWLFMSNWKSHQNVVQGHLVNFLPGVKNQMEQHNCMSLDPTGVYVKGQYCNTGNSHTVEFFVELTHQCKSCIQGNWAKSYFIKSMHNVVIGPWKHNGEDPLDVFACQDTNRVDGLSIWPPLDDLCLVESHIKMWFRDTWWLLVLEQKSNEAT